MRPLASDARTRATAVVARCRSLSRAKLDALSSCLGTSIAPATSDIPQLVLEDEQRLVDGSAGIGQPHDEVVQVAAGDGRNEDGALPVEVHRLCGPLGRLAPAWRLSGLRDRTALVGQQVPVEPLAHQDLDRLAVAIGQAGVDDDLTALDSGERIER